jgi:DNA-directed RNA polymerase specialized sigma subunit
MTDVLTEAIETATAAVAAIGDPVERYQQAREERVKLGTGDRTLMEIQQAVVLVLREGRTWAEVGEILGISGSRAEAIAKGR